MRRHSVESTGSAAREFNAYQRYRQQLQCQAAPNGSEQTITKRTGCLAKHHNPAVESSRNDRDTITIENRHRVCNLIA